MEPVKYLKDMLEITEGTVVDTAIDFGMGAAPVVGKVYQSYQLWKLQKRMTANEKQLLSLKGKVELSENEVFYKQEVFPLIVKSLMEDDEDTKAKVIIDGFEYIVDQELNEIERIYHYYDVLSELRYSDILMLIKRYMPFEMRKNPTLNLNLVMEEDLSKEERVKFKEMEAIEKYQVNKFLRLGLILDEMLKENEDGIVMLNPNISYDSRTAISDFGRRFLEFFMLEDVTEE
jgi:hypothetical protein